MRRDGGSRLRTQDDGAERPLEDEECGETDARDEASLASARDEDRDHRVDDCEEVARGGEVGVRTREPGAAAGIHAVEETGEEKKE